MQEKERAKLDSRIIALKTMRSADVSKRRVAKIKGGYSPRVGSHGDRVFAALADGGERTVDYLAEVTGAGKPTRSAAVLPKLINGWLI